MFKGTTRDIFVDKRDYSGLLWQQIEDAFQFVLRNIRLGAKIEGIYRRDIYELSPDSIRELIINAVMNCSFLQPSHVQVAIYDDRLEITSPGGLMPGVGNHTQRRCIKKYKICTQSMYYGKKYVNYSCMLLLFQKMHIIISNIKNNKQDTKYNIIAKEANLLKTKLFSKFLFRELYMGQPLLDI